jgi:hypothetical protein
MIRAPPRARRGANEILAVTPVREPRLHKPIRITTPAAIGEPSVRSERPPSHPL